MKRLPSSCFLLAAGVSLMAGQRPAIVFTQLPANTAQKPALGATLRQPDFAGARIAILDSSGPARVLTAGFHSAADPTVSWDGKRILFAAKKTAHDHWQVYEMDPSGANVKQLARVPWDCRSPIYQSRIFYLDDQHPEPQITFTGSAGHLNEYGEGFATSLYSARLDGSGLRRLTFNPSSDFDPMLNEDGRILYSGWQRHTLAWGPAGRVVLFGLNLDGTDQELFAGDEGRRVKQMACYTPERRIVFVESDQAGWDGGGNLAAVDLRRNLHSYRELTSPDEGVFAFPSAFETGALLVSRRAAAGAYGIFRFDMASRRAEKIHSDDRYHSLQAKAVIARPTPDGRSSVVEEKDPNAKLYCLSVFKTAFPDRSWHGPAVVKRVRVLEGVPLNAPSSAGLTSTLAKRLLGEFDVEPDGSFQVQLPANIPVQVQSIDSDGMALRTSAWFWTKNKENRGCIGCHEDHELTPENVFAAALGKPAIALTLPPERRRTVEFQRDVQPILQKYCALEACHGSGQLPPKMQYDDLMRWVDAGQARTSPLVWAIFGRLTARPWDKVRRVAPSEPMPPAGNPPLPAEAKRIILEWIDTGACNGATHAGGRQ